MTFVKAANVADVQSGKGVQVNLSGKTLAVFNIDGNYFAVDGECTHRGAPLAEGACTGAVVECPWHGARFDLVSGAHLSPPAPRGLTTYKVQVVGDEVQVDI